jgi:hypothetical protein
MDQTVHSTLQIFHGWADLKAKKSTKEARSDYQCTKLQLIHPRVLIRMNRFGASDRSLCASFDYLG